MQIHLTFTRRQNQGGESILFLHSLGSNGLMWSAQQEALSHYDCIIPDLPGHGNNNHIPWISLEETARLIAELIERNANDGKAHLVGASLGSYVVMEILAKHPKVARKAILCSINVHPAAFRHALIVWRNLVAPFVKTQGVSHLFARQLSIPLQDYNNYFLSVKQMSTQAFRAANREALNYVLPTNAAEIQQAVLVVVGGNENKVVHDSMHTILNTLPQAAGAIAPFMGQRWYGQKPEMFTDMITNWFKGYPLPDSLLPVEQVLEM